MAVLSVPLRGAEVERVPLWGSRSGSRRQINCARVLSRNCDGKSGETREDIKEGFVLSRIVRSRQKTGYLNLQDDEG
jgi:hypothetical protein